MVSQSQLAQHPRSPAPMDNGSSFPVRRPLALRAQSVDETWTQFEPEDNEYDGHVRRKSHYTASSGLPLSTRRAARRVSAKGQHGRPSRNGMTGLNAVQEGTPDDRLRPSFEGPELLTPPITPIKSNDSMSTDTSESKSEIKMYDFARIDYEIDRAKAIGKGLWSHVYWAQPLAKSPGLSRSPLTPPSTPEKPAAPPCSLYAVKLPARPDSTDIFTHEAKMLTLLQQSRHSHHFIVPFYGLDPRASSCALLFEAVLGGSLEHLVARLKVMTELSRHLELRTVFPTLALDLTAGLSFIHASGVVHADIKPANILLDIASDSVPRPTLRARYIDFSASFALQPEGDQEGSQIPNAGGTWDYMAPEQLSRDKDISTPSPASDVWSVGATLLDVLAGGSPYAAVCGTNGGNNSLFLLREAIKTGDPLGFARGDPVVRKRMAACQDFVDCCRLALQKDRERRVTAAAWEEWVGGELLGE